MALTLVDSGTVALDPGDNAIATITGPGVFVAVLDFTECDACVLRTTWDIETGAATHPFVYRNETTVDVAGLISGLLVPPVPYLVSGNFAVNLISGTPTGDLWWELYQL